MPDTCSTCGATRKPREQWYTVPTEGEPDRKLCPSCAPPDLVAKRKVSRQRFLRRRP